MKKFRCLTMMIALALCVGVFCVACNKPAPTPPAPPVLSGDTTIAVSKVAGADVTDGAVTLTAAQWSVLSEASDLKAQCEYTLADKATLVVTLVDKTLTFAVTAEDGTTASLTVAVTVLSGEAQITVSEVAGKAVTDGAVTLTQDEYVAWMGCGPSDGRA